jgi:hypothetical protein
MAQTVKYKMSDMALKNKKSPLFAVDGKAFRAV